jgi:hypothetical protein
MPILLCLSLLPHCRLRLSNHYGLTDKNVYHFQSLQKILATSFATI